MLDKQQGMGLVVLARGFVLAVVCLLASVSLFASTQTLADSEQLYRHTDYEASLARLELGSSDGATNFLAGRDFFMLGEFKKAAEYFQKAVASDPSNGDYVDWLGRAYGRRAETANVLAAPGLASKAHQAFEKAVELAPHDSDALSDLFDYYLEAPGFLGGGLDKASDIADRISAIDPAEGYFEKAKLAQKRREFDSAEQHLRRAILATPHKASGLLAYARFLAMQGRTKESDAVLTQAREQHPNEPGVWYTSADLFIRERRNLPEAKDLLQKYMSATLTVDDPSKQDAARLLKQVGGA